MYRLMQPSLRNSNIELLRVFSMLMIVLYHLVIYSNGGGFCHTETNVFANVIWNRTLSLFGALGVNIFVLITGWCLIKDDTGYVNIFKLLKFYGQLLFYSICITVPYLVFVKHSVSFSDLLTIIFPISNETWWFASAYFILFVLHPFVNVFLRSINKTRYRYYLMVIFIIASVVPFYSYFSGVLAWFICLYSLSAYVRLYGTNRNVKRVYYVIAAVISLLFIVTSSFVIESIPSITDKYIFFYGKRQLPVLILSFAIFMSFLTMKQFHSVIVNTVGLSTFGVYLISDHEIVRNIIWGELLDGFTKVDSQCFILESLIFAVVVFFVCSLIDIVRHLTVEQLYLKLLACLKSISVWH